MKRWVPWLTGIAITGLLVWSFFYLKELHPLGSLGAKLDDDSLAGVAIRFKDATLVGRANGQKVWSFRAKTIDVSKDRRQATFRGVARGELLEKGKKIADLSADAVTYNTFTRDVQVPGVARFELVDGPSFKVRNVQWDAAESKLICHGGVDASLAGSELHGEKMVANLRAKELTIEKVSGVVRLEKSGL